ncbi:hypothetical protein C0993_009682, partial [Termitomyces sp. T159_Od127]
YTVADASTIPSILHPPTRNGLSRAELMSIWCTSHPPPDPVYGPKNRPLNMDFCSSARFCSYAKNQSISCIWYTSNEELELRINALSMTDSLNDIPSDLPPPEPPPDPLSSHAITSDTKEEVSQLVPPQYHSYLDVFDPVKVKKLPPHHPYNCSIDLEDGKTLPFGLIYSLSEDE